MVLMAVRGAMGFLTRIPMGRSERAWAAFGAAPSAMVLVAYVIGAGAGVPFLLPLPPTTIGVLYVLALLGITGIAHADGLADVADAAVVHGSPSERRDVLRDTVVGVGGTVAIGVDVLGLGLAGLALAGGPWHVAVGLVVAAEIGAKLAMLFVAGFGPPTHDGLGSHLSGVAVRHLVIGSLVALPASVLLWPSPVPALALAASVATVPPVVVWSRFRLGGVNGDVLGATNELARLVALHVGVIAWMHF